ncbi:MAG: Gfo/Idh/MocA family oxidoreductase [Planctomycetaceae bacterium]|nr:Gfo/Idh/MocA family oxidoreductase [Planctomycetaceae bacterium]
MSQHISRRDALKTTAAAAGSAMWFATSPRSARAERSANEKLNLACIGVGGRGAANVGGTSGENFVAFCDVDTSRAGKTLEKYPGVKLYADFRKMLDEVENDIDGVVISTPDHTHFHPAMMALEMGKHVYCEKPMAHSVWEVREMTKKAKEKGVATQLGVQRHVLNSIHKSVDIIKAGAIGKVTDVYSWMGGSRGMPPIPQDKPAVPDHLDWDLWIGPAAMRPYHPSICPYGWRFWWDYGTGETGNFGCHILDIPFWALDLKYPSTVSASGPPVHELTTPKSMETKFFFPEQNVNLYWSHTAAGPDIVREKNLKVRGMNTVFVGTEGILATGFGDYKLYPEEKFEGYKVEDTIPKSPGFHKEWINACKGDAPATCEFGYSGPLTETVLLGNVAYRSGGQEFEWDAEKLKAIGNEAAQNLIVPEFRQGWEI